MLSSILELGAGTVNPRAEILCQIGDKICFVAPPARSRLCKTLGQAAPDTRQHLTPPD